MTNKQIELVIEMRSCFASHFGYYPNYPNEIDFDAETYVTLLKRCISEEFDHTIELYGTKPAKLPHGRQPGEMIID